jgi:hypothetical protein
MRLMRNDPQNTSYSHGIYKINGVLTGRNLVMLINLRKELDKEEEEKEELRQVLALLALLIQRYKC